MSERFDLLIKFYLRVIAIAWICFVPFLYLISYLSASQDISFTVFLSSLFEWLIMLPFGFETTVPSDFVPIIRFFFWSFWAITISRWIITGKHFYQ